MVVCFSKLTCHCGQVARCSGLKQLLVQVMQVALELSRVVNAVCIRKVKAKGTVNLDIDKAWSYDATLYVDHFDVCGINPCWQAIANYATDAIHPQILDNESRAFNNTTIYEFAVARCYSLRRRRA